MKHFAEQERKLAHGQEFVKQAAEEGASAGDTAFHLRNGPMLVVTFNETAKFYELSGPFKGKAKRMVRRRIPWKGADQIEPIRSTTSEIRPGKPIDSGTPTEEALKRGTGYVFFWFKGKRDRVIYAKADNYDALADAHAFVERKTGRRSRGVKAAKRVHGFFEGLAPYAAIVVMILTALILYLTFKLLD